jgi:hypothetical protein
MVDAIGGDVEITIEVDKVWINVDGLCRLRTYNASSITFSELDRLRAERDNLYGYVNGLLGLLQIVRGRGDMPTEIADALRTNHRAADAAAYLTQIAPPQVSP